MRSVNKYFQLKGIMVMAIVIILLFFRIRRAWKTPSKSTEKRSDRMGNKTYSIHDHGNWSAPDLEPKIFEFI